VESLVDQDELTRVLAIHTQAYKFLLWLDKQACQDPDMLAPSNVAALREPETCAVWLQANAESFPAKLVPDHKDIFAFARMLSSFFETSFHVHHVEFDGRILEARLARGADSAAIRRGARRSPTMVVVHALRRLAQSESISIDRVAARRLADRSTLRVDTLIWAYAVELIRRAGGASKGAVVHEIWRKIDRSARLNLTADRVWESRQRLVAALRDADAQGR
jgi:hypothetical protein